MLQKVFGLSLLCTLFFLLGTYSILPHPATFVTEESNLQWRDNNDCPYFMNLYSGAIHKVLPINYDFSSSNDSTQILPKSQYYLNKINNRVQSLFKCKGTKDSRNRYYIMQTFDNTIPEQGYKIYVNESRMYSIELRFSSYSGYVYALETFYQMIEEKGIVKGFVADEPIVGYRGIMIDPVRHFISVGYIKKLIVSMPISKLNVLHWHLSDDEAFVLELISHPELAISSRYSQEQFYRLKEVKEILQLASLNAVQIVPEIDTPGHVRAWGLSQEWKNKGITILCPGGEHYNNQFDLSKPQLYKLVKDVLGEVSSLFSETKYFHFGGDEVFGSCWNLRPSIQEFMAKNNIHNYGQLVMYWRSALKSYVPNKSAIFWKNDAENVTTGPQDILHYWGVQAQTAQFTAKSDSKIILSPTDLLYIGHGTTNIWVNKTNGDFKSWRQIYLDFTVRPNGVDPQRILGAEVCLWNEMQNQNTLENVLWMRASAFAAKAWRNEVRPLAEVAKDLISIQKSLKSMGVQPSPITNQFCEIWPQKCFSVTQKAQIKEKVLIE